MSVIELSQVMGNFGEFVGAIAVIATLIYLAVQVRQAKDLARESARAVRFQSDLNMLTSIIDAETYLQAWDKVESVDGPMYEYAQQLIADYDLSGPEALNMTMFAFGWWNYQQHVFLSAITPEDRQMNDAQMAVFLETPVHRKFWNDSSKQMLDHRFVLHVESILKDRSLLVV